MSKNKHWQLHDGVLYLTEKRPKYPKLDNGVYELNYDDRLGFGLIPISNDFSFDYKVYELEEDIIRRTLNYYKSTTFGNLGILLNGIRGTGKTVTSKILCNKLNQPVIIISKPYVGAESYINSIQQNFTVFIDEYEKNYEDSHRFLTIMDGALNSSYRRVFILTTNNLHVDTNLIDRPSRVRYLKNFGNLKPKTVEEILDDILIYPEYREDAIKYISTLDLITVDIVKAVINEINIQNESPFEFQNIFNAKVKTGKYKLAYKKDGAENEVIGSDLKISPSPDFDDKTIGSWFYVNDNAHGRIIEVLDSKTIVVNITKEYFLDDEEEFDDYDGDNSEEGTEREPIDINTIPINRRGVRIAKGIQTLVIEKDYNYNSVYKYSGYKGFDGFEYDY